MVHMSKDTNEILGDCIQVVMYNGEKKKVHCTWFMWMCASA